MKFNTLVTLASAIAFASAIPNPYPEPTAAVEQRAADPMTCIVDGQGTRCLPDRARRTAAPELVDRNGPPKPYKHTKRPKTTSSPIPNGCFIDPVNSLTRCENTVPICTTSVVSGTTQVACILKRGAMPEPTPPPMAVERRDDSDDGWYSSDGALCTVEDAQTRCIPNTPTCTTDVVDGTTQVACVLKRDAMPEPTSPPMAVEQRGEIEARGWYSSDGALCTVEDAQTRCIPNTPTCTTDVVDGTTQVACVL